MIEFFIVNLDSLGNRCYYILLWLKKKKKKSVQIAIWVFLKNYALS